MKCTKCNGRGRVTGMILPDAWTCDVCKGSGTMPLYLDDGPATVAISNSAIEQIAKSIADDPGFDAKALAQIAKNTEDGIAQMNAMAARAGLAVEPPQLSPWALPEGSKWLVIGSEWHIDATHVQDGSIAMMRTLGDLVARRNREDPPPRPNFEAEWLVATALTGRNHCSSVSSVCSVSSGVFLKPEPPALPEGWRCIEGEGRHTDGSTVYDDGSGHFESPERFAELPAVWRYMKWSERHG